MKTLNLTSIVFLFISSLVLFTSCGKDSDDPEPHGNDDFFFSCSLEGEVYDCIEVYSYALQDDEAGTMSVYGVQPDGSAIYIKMPQNLSTGKHAFSTDIFSLISVGDKTYSTELGTPNGEINISKRTDEIIEGTFSYTTYDFDDYSQELIVDSGAFKVKFRF